MYNVHYSICAITSYSILPTVYENALKIRATSGALLYVVATIDRARSRAIPRARAARGIVSP